RVRVVIVDDAQPLRALLRSTLNRDGRFDVVGEAADGREGVQVVLSSVPDVVLLDLAMPVMDGLEAIPRIVAGSPGTRIVVLSGFEARQVEEEVIELGAAAYLPKGVRPGELTETLTRLCVTGPMCAAHGRRHGVPPPTGCPRASSPARRPRGARPPRAGGFATTAAGSGRTWCSWRSGTTPERSPGTSRSPAT